MWHGLFIDGWREILRKQKKALGYSNEKIAERANLSESVVARDLMDGSDPPLSRIAAISTALEYSYEELFIPSLPNGMKLKTLVEEYVRVTEENKALRDDNAVLRATVDTMRLRNDELKDEILEVHRYYMRRDG